jgi:hypothetical protein
MIAWLNTNQGFVMALLTFVYVVATIVICAFNAKSAKAAREQTKEIKRQFDEENRPYITVELILEKRLFYFLKFSNHGRKIANNVKIELDQDFIDSLTEPSAKARLENQKGRYCIIGIGQSYMLPIGTYRIRYNADILPATGYIVFSDGEKQYDPQYFSIDLNEYMTFFSVNSETEDVLKVMKEQRDALKSINRSLVQGSQSLMMESDVEPE